MSVNDNYSEPGEWKKHYQGKHYHTRELEKQQELLNKLKREKALIQKELNQKDEIVQIFNH